MASRDRKAENHATNGRTLNQWVRTMGAAIRSSEAGRLVIKLGKGNLVLAAVALNHLFVRRLLGTVVHRPFFGIDPHFLISISRFVVVAVMVKQLWTVLDVVFAESMVGDDDEDEGDASPNEEYYQEKVEVSPADSHPLDDNPRIDQSHISYVSKKDRENVTDE